MNQKQHKRFLYLTTWVGYSDFFKELDKFDYILKPKLYLKKSVGDLMKKIIKCPLCKMPLVQFGSTPINELAVCGKCYLMHKEYLKMKENGEV